MYTSQWQSLIYKYLHLQKAKHWTSVKHNNNPTLRRIKGVCVKPFVFLAAFAACTPVCAQQSQEVVSEQASSSENSEQERTVENEENQSSQDESGIEVIDIIKRDTITESALDNRLEGDKEALDNVFAITQHRQNYLLPITYVSNPSSVASEELTNENIDNKEAKFQVSAKLPLYLEDTGFDGVYFGFTLTSFWQLYNSEASKPFRETNYEPEVFWQETADYSVLGYKFNTFQVGFNHMSNGQSGCALEAGTVYLPLLSLATMTISTT